jgi:hypothetical protein
MGQMVGLENCCLLDVTWMPIGELHARQLRAVIPAGGELQQIRATLPLSR